MVGVLMELGVAEPVPAYNAPAVANQLQQRLWCGAQAGEKEVGVLKGLAVALFALVPALLGVDKVFSVTIVEAATRARLQA